MAEISAPFSPEQVSLLNRFQRCLTMHPFTCGSDNHDGIRPTLVAGPDGWICPDPACDYTQGWAHDFMADREFVEAQEENARWWAELAQEDD